MKVIIFALVMLGTLVAGEYFNVDGLVRVSLFLSCALSFGTLFILCCYPSSELFGDVTKVKGGFFFRFCLFLYLTLLVYGGFFSTAITGLFAFGAVRFKRALWLNNKKNSKGQSSKGMEKD